MSPRPSVPRTNLSRTAYFQFVVGALAASALIAGILIGGYAYNEQISSVTCLACLGIDPVSDLDFRFETASGDSHPDWVLEPLKEKVVLIDFTQEKGTGCTGCDKMHPIMIELEDDYEDNVEFIVVYMFQNNEREGDYSIYKDGKIGVPTFIIITLNQDDDGKIKPYWGEVSGVIPKSEMEGYLDDALALHLTYRYQYDS